MITLHHLDHSRSQSILWLLEELGVDYSVEHYRRDPKTRLAPAELKAVHPLGKSPVLVDDGLVLAECGLIASYLCDRYDKGGRLAPPKSLGPDSAERLRWLYWLHYVEGTAMPAFLLKLILGGIAAPELDAVKAGFVDPQVRLNLDYWVAILGCDTWFAGPDFSAADILMSFPIEALARFPAIAVDPVLNDFVDRVRQRPAYQRAQARGQADGRA